MTTQVPQAPPAVDAAGPPTIARNWSALLAVIVVVGLGLRLYGLDEKSLTNGEAFAVWVVRQPTADLGRYVFELEQHSPLYYFLLQGWSVLGESEWVLRAFSVLWGVLTIPVVYGIGATVGGRGLGLLSAALLAVSPLHIESDQVVWMMSMATFFAAASVLCMLRVLEDERPAGVRALLSPWSVGLAASTALAMLTHRLALLLAVSLGLFLVLTFVVAGLRSHVSATRTLVAAQALGLGLLLWLPWLPSFLGQWGQAVEEEAQSGTDWQFGNPDLSVETFLGHVGDMGSADLVTGLWTIPVAVAFLVLAVLGGWRLRRRPAVLTVMVLVLLVPVVGWHLVALRPAIFGTRPLMWSTPVFAVLLAAGVLQLKLRAAVVAATVTLLALNAVSLVRYHADSSSEDWRAAARYVADRAQPGDVVLFNAASGQLPFDYYYRGLGAPIVEYGVPATLFDSGIREPRTYPADLDRIDRLLTGRPRIWLLNTRSSRVDPDFLVIKHLNQRFPGGDRQLFPGLTLFRYQEPTVSGP